MPLSFSTFLESENRLDLVEASAPIYRYRCSEAEYTAARSSLSQSLQHRRLAQLSDDECAMTCIVCAEWWRREYREGVWAWAGPQTALGLDPDAVQYTEWQSVLERGLKALGRTVHVTRRGRLFLMTLACEGGLPLRLISKNSPLRRWFREILRHLEALGMSGREPIETLEMLARNNAWTVPKSLHQEVAHRLVGRLAGEVWALHQEVDELPSVQPLEHLDKQAPEWRSQLPLRLDDESARALVFDLFSDASAVRAGAHSKDGISVECWMSSVDGGWRIERRVVFRPTVDDSEMNERFGERDSDPLPSRMLLRGLNTREVEQDMAWVRRSHGGHWRVEPLLCSIRNVVEDVTIRAVRAGFSRTANGILGSDALSPQPWVFRKRGAEWQLVGEGSTRRREPELLVVVATDENTTVRNGHRVGELTLGTESGVKRVVWKARRRLVVEQNGEIYTIDPGSDRDEGVEASLTGRIFGLGGTQQKLFRGLPSMRVQHAGRNPIIKGPEELEWRIHGRPWSRLSTCPGGRVQVRWTGLRGQSVIRWARILPADFELQLEPGSEVAGGYIRVKGKTVQQVGLPAHRDLECAHSGPHRVHVRPRSKQVPAFVPLFVLFRQGGGDLTLQVPAPIVRLSFERVDGTPLKRNAITSLEQLGRTRAVCAVPSGQPNLMLSLSMRQAHNGQEWSWSERLPSNGLGSVVVELRDFRERIEHLLNMSNNLDARVHVHLIENTARLANVRISVGRYTTKLIPEKADGMISVESSRQMDEESLQRLRIDAVDLTKPQASEMLPAVVSGGQRRWMFDPANRSPGPWLVLAQEDTADTASRPVLWVVRGEEPAEDAPAPCTLHDCITDSRIHGDKRQATMAKRLAHLFSTAPHSEEWQLVRDTLNLAARVPGGSLDLVCALARVPDAAAWSVLSLGGNQDAAWEMLDDLPFLWEVVSLQTWERCFGLLREDLVAKGVPDAYVAGVLESLVRPIVDRGGVPGLAFKSLNGEGASQSFNLPMLKLILKPKIGAVVGRHIDERWPMLQSATNYPAFSKPLKEVLRALSIPDQMHFRHLVLMAPFICAQFAASGMSEECPELIPDLRRAKDFDEIWFDEAFFYGFALMSQ